MKCSLGISNFLEEISSLSHSVVLLYFFALITEKGFLIAPSYSLELCIQMFISYLFCFAFHFSSFHSYLQGLPRQPFCFFAFIFHSLLWSTQSKALALSIKQKWMFFWNSCFFNDPVDVGNLISVSCTMLRTSVHSSSGTLSLRSSPLNLFLTSTV